MNKNEQIKVYKTKEQRHYEKFEDTIKYLNFDEWKLFLTFVKQKEDLNRRRNTLIFRLQHSTGCRVLEFSLIKVQDIDFKIGLINIPWENTKTKKRRTVRVNKEVLLDLKEYLLDNNIKSGFIFRNKNNKPLTTRFYQKLFDKYHMDDLPFKIHPHTLRHTHVVHALRKGVPINAVQQQVGHMDLKTTAIYCRLAGIDVMKGYEGIDI